MGQYQTPGKRSPNWGKGVLYEGMFNRWISSDLVRELDYRRVPYVVLNPEFRDVSLRTLSTRANKIYANNPDVYVLSLHANAGGGKGIEGFTYFGQSESDLIANIYLSEFRDDVKLAEPMRLDFSDGDMDKEANYHILRETRCPSVLLELGFMDTKSDYNKLWSRAYQDRLVQDLANAAEKLFCGV